MAEQDQSPESSAEDTLDEEIVGLKISSNDGGPDNTEIDEARRAFNDSLNMKTRYSQ